MALVFLKSNFELVFLPHLRFQPGVLSSEFIILGIFILDHTAQLFLLLIVPEEVILKIPGLAIGFPVLLLPIFNLFLQVVVSVLHP